MADNRPRWCSRCVEEQQAAERVQANREYLPCAWCGEPACTDHARDYPGGWEHPECHESPSYSRFDYAE